MFYSIFTKLLLSSMLLGSSIYAVDHIGLRLSERGLLAIIKTAIDQKLKNLESGELSIPNRMHEVKINKKDLLKNPAITILNQISDVNLNKDFIFYVTHSDFKVKARLDRQSLKLNVKKLQAQVFEFSLAGQLKLVDLTASEIRICETRLKNRCGQGISTAFIRPSVKLDPKSNPIRLEARFRIDLQGRDIKIEFLELKNNFISKNAPFLNSHIQNLEVPPAFITIDGVRTEIEFDKEELRNQLLTAKMRQYFSEEILKFAAEFAAKDLVIILNKYFKSIEVASGWNIFSYQNPKERWAIENPQPYIMARDNTYVRPSATEIYFRRQAQKAEQARDLFGAMVEDLSRLIRSAEMYLQINNLASEGGSNLDLGLLTNFKVNNRAYYPGTTIANSSTPVTSLNFDDHGDHIQIAISEPWLNSILKAASDIKLIEKAFDQLDGGEEAFRITGVQSHFNTKGTITLVAFGELDLSKARAASNPSEPWYKNFTSYLETELGKLIQKVSSCAYVGAFGQVIIPVNCPRPIFRFPMEFELTPRLKTNEKTNEQEVEVSVDTPFQDELNLKNSFRYPSNFNQLVDVVQKGVVQSLRDGFSDVIGQTFPPISINQLLKHDAVKFKLKRIQIKNNSYLILGADIEEVNLSSLRSK